MVHWPILVKMQGPRVPAASAAVAEAGRTRPAGLAGAGAHRAAEAGRGKCGPPAARGARLAEALDAGVAAPRPRTALCGGSRKQRCGCVCPSCAAQKPLCQLNASRSAASASARAGGCRRCAVRPGCRRQRTSRRRGAGTGGGAATAGSLQPVLVRCGRFGRGSGSAGSARRSRACGSWACAGCRRSCAGRAWRPCLGRRRGTFSFTVARGVGSRRLTGPSAAARASGYSRSAGCACAAAPARAPTAAGTPAPQV